MPLGRVIRIRSPCVDGGGVGERGIIGQAAFPMRKSVACRRGRSPQLVIRGQFRGRAAGSCALLARPEL